MYYIVFIFTFERSLLQVCKFVASSVDNWFQDKKLIFCLYPSYSSSFFTIPDSFFSLDYVFQTHIFIIYVQLFCFTYLLLHFLIKLIKFHNLYCDGNYFFIVTFKWKKKKGKNWIIKVNLSWQSKVKNTHRLSFVRLPLLFNSL